MLAPDSFNVKLSAYGPTAASRRRLARRPSLALRHQEIRSRRASSPTTQWAKLEAALLLAPSSYGLQPYKFIVVNDPALREQLKGAAYGQEQITDCSHLVVFAARLDITEQDVEHYLARIGEVRGVERAKLEGYAKVIKGDVVNGPRHAVVREWTARQAYIALGQLMTVAAVESIDVCPMEGFDTGKFDEILGLPAAGYRAVVLAAVGHRAEDDGAASLPKVRLPAGELIEHR